jgi:hypothetical protein
VRASSCRQLGNIQLGYLLQANPLDYLIFETGGTLLNVSSSDQWTVRELSIEPQTHMITAQVVERVS